MILLWEPVIEGRVETFHITRLSTRRKLSNSIDAWCMFRIDMPFNPGIVRLAFKAKNRKKGSKALVKCDKLWCILFSCFRFDAIESNIKQSMLKDVK